MKKNLLASLAIAAICLYFALRPVHWSEVGTSLKTLHWMPVLLMLIPMGLTHLFRARRWQVLLRPVKAIGFRDLFLMNAVGFLAINVFPLRLGELTRPLLLRKRHGIPFSTGLATIGIERIFDALTMALCLTVGLLFLPNAPVALRSLGVIGLGALCAGLALLILSVHHRQLAIRILSPIVEILPQKFHVPAKNFLEHFFDGMKALPNFWSLARLGAESFGVWSVMVVAYWLGLKSMGLELPWSAPLAILGIAAVGLMIPGAPGFVGTYQLAIQTGMGLYGISTSLGLTYSLIMHAVNLVFVLVIGLISLPFVTSGLTKLYAESANEASSST